MRQIPSRQMAVVGTHIVTGQQVFFPSAYYAPGFNRSGIKEAISGRAKTHRGYAWRYATKVERENWRRH